jgi:peroxiredoxin
LRGYFDDRGIQIIAVCTDTPEQIQAGKTKHGLQAIFISDNDLSFTDAFGLRNLNTAVRPPGVPGLPVPTTLFVGSDGVVLWKDQSTDYQQRSDPERVKAALSAF